MKIKLLTACFSLLLASSLFPTSLAAQERPAQATLTVDFGNSKTRNTYLAPLLYEGTQMGVRFDRLRTMRSGKWHNLQTLTASYATGEAENGKNSETWAGRAVYRYAMHRSLFPSRLSPLKTNLLLGPYASVEAGFDYNLKLAAANNPAAARMAANVGVSLMAGKKYSLRGRECSVDFLAQMPILGTAFRPEYGASYYETFLIDKSPEVSHITSLHNQQDLDLRLTTDIPLATIPGLKKLKTVVRIGGYYHIETMDINKIVTRHSSLGLTIGWTWRYLPL